MGETAKLYGQITGALSKVESPTQQLFRQIDDVVRYQLPETVNALRERTASDVADMAQGALTFKDKEESWGQAAAMWQDREPDDPAGPPEAYRPVFDKAWDYWRSKQDIFFEAKAFATTGELSMRGTREVPVFDPKTMKKGVRRVGGEPTLKLSELSAEDRGLFGMWVDKMTLEGKRSFLGKLGEAFSRDVQDNVNKGKRWLSAAQHGLLSGLNLLGDDKSPSPWIEQGHVATARQIRWSKDKLKSDWKVGQWTIGAARMAPSLLASIGLKSLTGNVGPLAMWGLKIAPDRYEQMTAAGVKPELALPFSMVTSIPEAAIEIAQIDRIVPGAGKAFKTILRGHLGARLGRAVVNLGIDVGIQTIEETLQGHIGSAGVDAARWADKNVENPTIREALMNAWNAGITDAKEAMGPLTILSLIGRIPAAGRFSKQALLSPTGAQDFVTRYPEAAMEYMLSKKTRKEWRKISIEESKAPERARAAKHIAQALEARGPGIAYTTLPPGQQGGDVSLEELEAAGKQGLSPAVPVIEPKPGDVGYAEGVAREAREPGAQAGVEPREDGGIRPRDVSEGEQAAAVAEQEQAAEEAAPVVTEAEAVRAEAEARPEAEFVFAGIPVEQPRMPLREDVVGQRPAYPTQEVSRRMEQARGVRKPGTVETVRALGAAFGRKLRVREHLPNIPEFDTAREIMRLHDARSAKIPAQNARTIAGILDPMGENQYGLFQDSVYADNMAWSLSQGQPLRHGFESEQQVAAWKAQVDATVAATPEVREALANRKRVVRELVGDLVSNKMLPEDTDPDHYYHQQVLHYANTALSSGTLSMRFRKKGFQKARIVGPETMGEELDYNTLYIASEAEWMNDARQALEKKRALDELESQYGAEPGTEGHREWQPRIGNVFYQALTIPTRLAEQLHQNLISLGDIDKEMLKEVLAVGGQRRAITLPNEIVDQLESMDKPKPVGTLAAGWQAMFKAWKIWTLLNPKRALQYMTRNLTGDLDPVIAAKPSALLHVPGVIADLSKMREGAIALPQQIEEEIDLGVIDSGLVAQEIPDLKEMALFKRYFKEQRPAGTNAALRSAAALPKRYFDVVRKYNNFRENILRSAAYRAYLKDLTKRSGNMKGFHYGGSNKATVDTLIRTMGNKVAAANLARNLLGDYGNISVMGNWLRKNLMPFWSWMEINTIRTPRLLINALRVGKGKGLAAGGVLTAAALSRIGSMYAAFWAFNHLFFRDEEEDLDRYTRANPHIILGRNPDGSVKVFRNVGAIGDFIEWFGVNTLVSRWPQYEANQITAKELLIEMAKDPFQKAVDAITPSIKTPVEVVFGMRGFPDVFEPRTAPRGELAAGLLGLRDEYKALRGVLAKEGSRARANYWQTYLSGVVDPRKSALYDMYDLREKYLKSIGKETPRFHGISKYRQMREAATNSNYQAFKEARDVYIEDGGSLRKFRQSLRHLDPIAARLNARDEWQFQHKFLTTQQRKKLGVMKRYAHELRDTMWVWWLRAAKEQR